jgi:hypothetical protein
MAVGFPAKTTYANGDVFSADDINSTNGTINLLTSAQYAAGKNRIINGDFRFNQRGFTSNSTDNTYNFDRWVQANGGSTGTLTITPQTFTPGTAPVSGYEAINYVQCVTAAGASTNTFALYNQYIEDTRTFAGQTVTLSFWAKATSGTPKIATEIGQNFGSGGSPSAAVYTAGGSVTLSTSWARYSTTISVPSVAGKTFGTTANTSYLAATLWLSSGSTFNTRSSSIGLQNATFQIWGVQLEAGSTATAFQTATGTIQGELALCQRYYYRQTAQQVYSVITTTQNISTTQTIAAYTMPVTMRVAPTAVEFSTLALQEYSTGGLSAVTVLTLEGNVGGLNTQSLLFTVSSGLTTNRVTRVLCNNSLSAYLGLSAEL